MPPESTPLTQTVLARKMVKYKAPKYPYQHLFNEALAAYHDAQYDKTVHLLEQAWQQGGDFNIAIEIAKSLDTKAGSLSDYDARTLGLMYLYGCGVEKNDLEAIEYFKKAASGGDIFAEFKLAWMYHRGSAVGGRSADNYRLAIEHYQKARQANYPEALFYLAVMYKEGHGVSGGKSVSNDEQAMTLFSEAIDLGCVTAYHHLACMLLDGRGAARGNQDANDRKALELLQQAVARIGHPNALMQLADMYLSGRGCGGPSPQNRNKAIELLQMAARQESGAAAEKLGRFYQKAHNLDLAISWFTTAAILYIKNSKRNDVTRVIKIIQKAVKDPTQKKYAMSLINHAAINKIKSLAISEKRKQVALENYSRATLEEGMQGLFDKIKAFQRANDYKYFFEHDLARFGSVPAYYETLVVCCKKWAMGIEFKSHKERAVLIEMLIKLSLAKFDDDFNQGMRLPLSNTSPFVKILLSLRFLRTYLEMYDILESNDFKTLISKLLSASIVIESPRETFISLMPVLKLIQNTDILVADDAINHNVISLLISLFSNGRITAPPMGQSLGANELNALIAIAMSLKAPSEDNALDNVDEHNRLIGQQALNLMRAYGISIEAPVAEQQQEDDCDMTAKTSVSFRGGFFAVNNRGEDERKTADSRVIEQRESRL